MEILCGLQWPQGPHLIVSQGVLTHCDPPSLPFSPVCDSSLKLWTLSYGFTLLSVTKHFSQNACSSFTPSFLSDLLTSATPLLPLSPSLLSALQPQATTHPHCSDPLPPLALAQASPTPLIQDITSLIEADSHIYFPACCNVAVTVTLSILHRWNRDPLGKWKAVISPC